MPNTASVFVISVILATLVATPSQMASAADNVWQELSPTPHTRWNPASFYDCTRTINIGNPIGRSFSGTVIGNGQIFFWGGGHSGYPGNDVELYDTAANAWIPDSVQPQCVAPICINSQQNSVDNYPPNCQTGTNEPYTPGCLWGSCLVPNGSGASKPVFECAGGTRQGQTCTTDADCPNGTCPPRLPTPGTPCPTCRPYTEHTYQRQIYNPDRGKFLVFSASGTWEWDPANRQWTWLGIPPRISGDIASRLMLYDPIRRRPLWINVGYTNPGILAFSYLTNTWSAIDPYLPTGTAQFDSFATWDGNVNKFIIALGNASGLNPRFFAYDPALTGAPAWTEITSAAPADVRTSYCPVQGAPLPCFAAALTYDATNRRTLVLAQESPNRTLALWAYDASTGPLGTWQKVTTTGGSGVRKKTGYPNMLHYDATTSTPTGASIFLVDERAHWPSIDVRTWKITLNLSPQTSGDLNADGSVDAIDLQLLVNVLLGLTTNPLADLNTSGSVDAVDLQLLVNFLLGL